jgi:hypothetical protein
VRDRSELVRRAESGGRKFQFFLAWYTAQCCEIEFGHDFARRLVTLRQLAGAPRRVAKFCLKRFQVHEVQRLHYAANWTAAWPTPGAPLLAELVDTDADGLPDVWEEANGTNPSVAFGGSRT